jgi:Icc-related predicted phosphoesterase
MGDLPHKHKICILGNHDRFEIRNQDLPKLAFEKYGITLLHNSGIEIDGLLFWGSPFTPTFGSWAWMRGRQGMSKIWAQIPDQTNVLITHGPAYGKLDKTARGTNAGCQDLWHRVKQLKDLKLHCCGHIHEGYGRVEVQGVQYVNAASCDLAYDPVNPPIVVEI